MQNRDICVTINGQEYRATVPIYMSLADFLREVAGLTGTHIGCGYGSCGACTVLMNGEAIRACLLLAVQANQCTVVTVEGLSNDGILNPLQEAFRRHHALQCGFCTPGVLMSATALLNDNPNADEQQVREALSGNLCRCTGYSGIVKAVLEMTQGETTKDQAV